MPPERGQTRQIYTITALGREELVTQLSRLSEHDARASDQFRFRVGMFQVIEPGVRLRILDTRERYLNSRIEKISAILDNFDLDRYSAEVTGRFVTESRAELDWIAHLRRISK